MGNEFSKDSGLDALMCGMDKKGQESLDFCGVQPKNRIAKKVIPPSETPRGRFPSYAERAYGMKHQEILLAQAQASHDELARKERIKINESVLEDYQTWKRESSSLNSHGQNTIATMSIEQFAHAVTVDAISREGSPQASPRGRSGHSERLSKSATVFGKRQQKTSSMHKQASMGMLTPNSLSSQESPLQRNRTHTNRESGDSAWSKKTTPRGEGEDSAQRLPSHFHLNEKVVKQNDMIFDRMPSAENFEQLKSIEDHNWVLDIVVVEARNLPSLRTFRDNRCYCRVSVFATDLDDFEKEFRDAAHHKDSAMTNESIMDEMFDRATSKKRNINSQENKYLNSAIIHHLIDDSERAVEHMGKMHGLTVYEVPPQFKTGIQKRKGKPLWRERFLATETHPGLRFKERHWHASLHESKGQPMDGKAVVVLVTVHDNHHHRDDKGLGKCLVKVWQNQEMHGHDVDEWHVLVGEQWRMILDENGNPASLRLKTRFRRKADVDWSNLSQGTGSVAGSAVEEF